MNKNIRLEDLPIYEIEVDEEGNQGIRMISLVADPAISVMGMYFSSDIEKEYRFKSVKEQQIIVGPAMIPDKRILRKDDNDNYYYVYFTKETIKKMVEKFLKDNNNKSLNIDHSNKMVPGFIQGTWIVEDPTYDKSRFYGFNLPVGSFFIEVKIEDKDFWLSEVKDEGRYGFSIEGLMGQKLVQMESVLTIDAPKYIDELIDDLKEEELEELLECFQESYDDYPKAATENAKIALRWAEENGWGSCGTPVGKARANQLAKGEPISRETIARMAAFARHLQWKDKQLGDGCGKLMLQAWGGEEGIAWAQRKLKEIDNQEFINGLIICKECGHKWYLEDGGYNPYTCNKCNLNNQEFIVEPKADESKDEFVSRCIGIEINSGKPQDQAAAICYAKWKSK
jgi:hypothetical protein